MTTHPSQYRRVTVDSVRALLEQAQVPFVDLHQSTEKGVVRVDVRGPKRAYLPLPLPLPGLPGRALCPGG